jgi:hypothetical protein
MFDHYERKQAGSDCARKREVLGRETQDEAVSYDKDDDGCGDDGSSAAHSLGKVTHDSASHGGEGEVQSLLDSYFTGVLDKEAGLLEQFDDFPAIGVPVTPMQMRQQPFLFPVGRSKVDCERSSARLEHPSHFTRQLAAGIPTQVMEHQCAQNHIKASVWKRQGLGRCDFKANVRPGAFRLHACPRDHLRRGVDPINRASCPDEARRHERKCSGSTAHIQDSLTGLQPGQLKEPFAKPPRTAE